jgi:NhaP-type Na+/H+ or K+/H+ antiporter
MRSPDSAERLIEVTTASTAHCVESADVATNCEKSAPSPQSQHTGFRSATIGGPIVGAALGYVTLWIRRRLANPGLETVQGLVVPFAAFICAEELHASGVLAVVVAGFVVGNGTLAAGYQTRLQERYVWNSVDVLLEAFVFAYIGLHLRFVLHDLHEAHESLTQAPSRRRLCC